MTVAKISTTPLKIICNRKPHVFALQPASRLLSSNNNDGHTKPIILVRPAIIGISS